MTKTIATLFSGGGGFDLGAIAAGYKPVFAIDNNADAVECYKRNIGDHIVLGDVRNFRFASTGIKIDHLHASPSCKSSSTANANKGETDFDIDCAYSIVRAIQQVEPETFSLENVREYHKTKSFRIIVEALIDNDYLGSWETLNAADYGVPQSRKRLILMASKIKKAEMPIATHEQNLSDPCFEGFQTKQKWIGWYEAIADLIPSLPETKLAPWQVKAMGTLPEDFPLLVENTGARSDRDLQTRRPDEPSWTVRAMGLDGHWHRANVLVTGNYSSFGSGKPSLINELVPCPTLTASQDKHPFRVISDCKVLAITPHCLARFQSFPDSYILPERKAIAGMIIGNAVPPLLAQRIMEAF